MGKHSYRLAIRHEFGVPLNEREQELIDGFTEKYNAIVTGNETKRRFTLHFSSDQPLEKGELEKELMGLKIIAFYEVG